MSLSSLIILIGIAQGFLLGIVLVTLHRGNLRANRILGILMILFSISIIHAFLFGTGYYKQFPHLLFIGSVVVFLFGPLLYFYVYELSIGKINLKKIYLLHFAPFLIYLIAMIPYFILDGASKIAVCEGWKQEGSFIDIYITPIQILHIFGYLYIANKRVNEHQSKIKFTYSSIDKINLAWVKTFIRMFLGVFGLMIIILILYLLDYREIINNYGSSVLGISVSICIYTAGYMGLKQPEIFIGGEENSNIKKYEKSNLTEEKSIIYLTRLLEVMKNERLFTDSNLKIQHLAEKMKIPGYQLSQLINEQLNQNFYDFVNRYRINDAKSKLQDPNQSHYSIFGIALDVGFNSKSAFNTAFKKHTGLTPSDFREMREQN